MTAEDYDSWFGIRLEGLMSRRDFIKCDWIECDEEHLEQSFNEGHPGWGHIVGIVNTETGEENAYLCPKHKSIVRDLISGKFRLMIFPIACSRTFARFGQFSLLIIRTFRQSHDESRDGIFCA